MLIDASFRRTPVRQIWTCLSVIFLVLLATSCLISTNTEAAEQQLSYDDGSAEFGFRSGSQVMGAVLFDAAAGTPLKKLRFYVWGEAESVSVYVLNSVQQVIHSENVHFDGSAGWYEIAVSDEGILLNGEFYVGWMWVSEHSCPPCSWLGVDKDGPPHYRSYLGTIGNLQLVKDVPEDHGVRQENYMIRVILQETESQGPRPVAYTDYSFAEPGPFLNQDMYFTWEDAPPEGYIYPAFQFSLQVSGGYMGVQLVGTSKKAIFSIWDTSNDSNTAQPVSDNCSRFGHEGTGTHCGIDYNWIEGREYRLRIRPVGTDATGELWAGTIFDTVTQQETTIGVIHLKSSADYVGYGKLVHNAYTFLEYFAGPNSCEGQPYSRVLWRGPYANTGEYTASRAVVPGYNDCIRTNVTTRGYPTAIQEAGTGVQRITPKGTVLWDSASRPCNISISGPSIITSGNEVISATTSSNVNKVRFFIDNHLKITDFNAPYSFTWNELQPSITYGTHIVTAKGFVYDSSGNEIACDSNSLSITVSQQQYNLRVQVHEATGAGSMISGATVLVNGSPVGTTDSNGEITLSVAQGQHTVTASKSGCTPHPGTGSWTGMVDHNMGIAIEMDCGGGSFAGSGFLATCTESGKVLCTLDYNNQLGEKAVVLFLFKKCATGKVTDHALPEVDLGTGTVHTEFDCSSSEPGTYCISWKAFRKSDVNLENAVAWSLSYEEQVVSCPCGEEPVPGSGDILFDQRDQHHYGDQLFPDIDSTGTIGYSTLRTALENAGYEINKLNSGLITNAILANYKILVIMPTLHNYSSSEITAIKSYVSGGGSVLILGDWAKYAPYINAVAEAFDTKFNGHRVANSTSNLNGDPFQPRIRNFGCSSPPCNHSLTHITDGIASYYMVNGTFIESGSPDKALAWFDWRESPNQPREHTWIDQNKNGYEDPGEEYRTGHGSCTVLSWLKYENGRVVFSADASFLYNSVVDKADNLQLGLNIISWLAETTSEPGPPAPGPPPPSDQETHTFPAGWSLVSVPLNSGTSVELFGTTAYRWNPVTGQYDMPTTIEPTKGYWVNLPSSRTVTDTGYEVTTDVIIDISSKGWHQISAPWSYSKSAIQVVKGTETKSWADAAAAGWIRDDIYGYVATDGAYTTPSTIDPWYGYWVRANVSGLTLKLLYASGTPVSTAYAPMAFAPADLPPMPPAFKPSAATLTFGNSPNPVVDVHTTIFEVKGAAAYLVDAIKVQVFDLSGRLVYESGKIPGTSLDWHTDNDYGELLANGVYLWKMYALIDGEWVESETKKLAILH